MTDWAWNGVDPTTSYEKFRGLANERLRLLSGTVNEKQRKIVTDVRDSGADWTGVRDARASIQKNLVAGNRTYLAPGTFIVTRLNAGTAYSLSGVSNITIEGAGRGVTTLKLADSQLTFTRILSLTNCSNVTIRGITFDGNVDNQSVGTEQRHALILDGCTNVLIEDNDFLNTEGDGIYVGATTQSKNVLIQRNRFANNHRNGITLGGSNGVRILGNYFEDDIDGSPIDSEPNTVNTENTVVQGNVFEANGEYAISLQGLDDSNPSLNWTINGNIFLGNSFFVNRAKKVSITGNVILWNQSVTNIPAVEIGGVAEDVVVADNYIESDQFGIYSYTTSSKTPARIRITGNDIYAVKETVRLIGVTGASVLGNMLTGNGTNHVILCQAANADNKNIVISGNTIKNGSQAGVALTRSSTSVISGLVISGNIFDDDQGTPTMLYGIRSLVNADYMGIPIFSGNVVRSAVVTAMSLPYTAQIFLMGGDRERGLYSCGGTPESAVTASIGSMALRRDGGASTTLYVKESGTGNTGWVAK